VFGKSDAVPNLVTKIEPESLTREALLKSTDAFITTFVERYSQQDMFERLSDVLAAAGTKVAAAVASTLGVGLIQAIWKQNDYVASQLKRIINQPFVSGSRMAFEAVSRPDGTPELRKFKEERLNAAINELYRAWGMLKDPKATTFDRYVIAKLQGLCFQQLDGGKELAIERFREATEVLVANREDIVTDINSSIKTINNGKIKWGGFSKFNSGELAKSNEAWFFIERRKQVSNLRSEIELIVKDIEQSSKDYPVMSGIIDTINFFIPGQHYSTQCRDDIDKFLKLQNMIDILSMLSRYCRSRRPSR
jgi:hypothetical protein